MPGQLLFACVRVSERRSWLIIALCAGTALVLGVIGGLWGRTPAGNTALVVPFGVGPAVVAAGWTALTLDLRTNGRTPGLLWRVALLGGGAALVVSLVSIYL